MNGGRQLWLAEDRPLTQEVPNFPKTQYKAPERTDAKIRAFRDQVMNVINPDRKTLINGVALVDVRSNPEYTGEMIHMANYPQEGAQRGAKCERKRSP